MTHATRPIALLRLFAVCLAMAVAWLPTPARAQDVELLREFLGSNGRQVDVVGLNNVESVDVRNYRVVLALAPLPDPMVLPYMADAQTAGLFIVYTDDAPLRPPTVQVPVDARVVTAMSPPDEYPPPILPPSVGFAAGASIPVDGLGTYEMYKWSDGSHYQVMLLSMNEQGERNTGGLSLSYLANGDLFSRESLMWPENRYVIWNLFHPDAPILIVIESVPGPPEAPVSSLFDPRWRVVLLHVLLVWLLGMAWLGLRVTPPLSPQTSVARYRLEHARAVADHLVRSRSGVAAARVLIRWTLDRLRERSGGGSPLDDTSLAIELARRSGLPVDVLRTRIARAEVLAAGTDDMQDAPEVANQLIALLRNRGDRK